MSLADRLSAPPPNLRQGRIDRLLDDLPEVDRNALDDCLRSTTPADWLSEQLRAEGHAVSPSLIRVWRRAHVAR